MKSIYKVSVQWGDTDAAGIVFFPNFYKWMDESAHAFFRDIELSTSQLLNDYKISIPLLETHCRFISPLRFEDEITVETSIELLKPKVFKLTHLFKKDGTIVAEGYSIRCWTSFESELRSVAIPEQVKKRLIEKGMEINFT